MISKRGFVFFMPLFAFLVIVALTTLAFAIQRNNTQRASTEIVGQQALSLVKVYDEGDKAALFLQTAARLAARDAWRIVGANGGYAAQNGCQRLLNDPSFIVLNSCSTFSPARQFQEQLRVSLAPYFQFYQSTYQPYKFEEELRTSLIQSLGLQNEPTLKNLPFIYSEQVRKASVARVNADKEQLLVAFSPLRLPVEFAETGSVYTITPNVRVPQPNLGVYDQVFSVAEFCVGKAASACSNQVRQVFPSAMVQADQAQDLSPVGVGRVQAQGFVQITIPDARGDIKVAIDLQQPLPLRESRTSIV